MPTKKLTECLENLISELCGNPSLFVRNPGTDFTRDRKLPVGRMIKIILSFGGKSIGRELFDYDPGSIVSTSAFVQQRDKLLPEMFEFIFHEFNDRSRKCDTNRYRGYRILATDGTDVNIARDETDETCVENGDREGYNQIHLNVIYDTLNKTYLDAVIQPRPEMDERRATLRMIGRMRFDRAILMADRGYESYNFFEHCHRKDGLEYLVRVKNGNSIKAISRLPMEELDVDVGTELRTTQKKEDKQAFREGRAVFISGPSKTGKGKARVSWDFESPCTVRFRICRFKIAEDKYATVATSLDRARFPLYEIKKLYHMRWGVETSFCGLKYAVGRAVFHSKKKEAVLQEVFARLAMYNFCQRITLSVVIRQDAGRRWTYRVNFTYAVHVCRNYLRHHGNEPPPEMERHIASHILPVRENRKFTRNIKKKSFTSFLYRIA